MLEYTEGNEKLAKFTGIEKCDYHLSLELLFQILVMIKDKGFCYEISDRSCRIFRYSYTPKTIVHNAIQPLSKVESTKDAIWSAVVEFAGWYENNSDK